jgi:hypothetical protein
MNKKKKNQKYINTIPSKNKNPKKKIYKTKKNQRKSKTTPQKTKKTSTQKNHTHQKASRNNLQQTKDSRQHRACEQSRTYAPSDSILPGHAKMHVPQRTQFKVIHKCVERFFFLPSAVTLAS